MMVPVGAEVRVGRGAPQSASASLRGEPPKKMWTAASKQSSISPGDLSLSARDSVPRVPVILCAERLDRASLLARFHELLELVPGALHGEERLDELEGWTSLAVIGFMALSNEEFGIVLSPR